MSDFAEFPKTYQEPPELMLSYEKLDKMASDVKTLSMLHDFAKDRGYVFALTGGYAVDALSGGRISRFHSDMDGIIIAPYDASYSAIKEGIEERLFVEETIWGFIDKDQEGELEYREKAPDKEWDMIRRLEVDIYPPGVKTVSRVLRDVDNHFHNFEVLTIDGLLAAKVLSTFRLNAMTEEERVEEGLREAKISDREDFQRLIHTPGFDENATLIALADAICSIRDDEFSQESAWEEAKRRWVKVLEIYQ